jgi:tRNA modification GTPase
MVESADIVLFVIDRSRLLDAADHEVRMAIKNPHVIVVANKKDLPAAVKADEFNNALRVDVSALTLDGVDELRSALLRVALDGKPLETHGVLVSNVRHIESLRRAHEALAGAFQSVEELKPAEFVAEDIKSAVNALDAITGRNVDADVVDEIFSKFCIGK